MAGRSLFSLFSLILVAGALLLMFFILLAGAVNGGPVNRWYFLEADTSNIPKAPQLARWTFWSVCEGSSGVNVCGKIAPARPLDPPSGRNFGTSVNVPEQFIGTRSYFYLTRFMFAFALMALFFSVCALFTGFLALCTRIGAYLSSMVTFTACFFQALTASLMTAAYVRGRDAFKSNNQTAHIGQYAFGFEWAAFACLFLASILFCVGGRSRRDRTHTTTTTTTRRRFFRRGRARSTRSRNSFFKPNKEYV